MGKKSGIAWRSEKKALRCFHTWIARPEIAGVKDHIAYMKPSGSDLQGGNFKVFQVEMKLHSISLHQFSAFLHGVETSDSLVRVKKASIAKTGQSAEGIDAILWVETIAP